ncbi:MAG: hypothetical protein K2Y29_21415 [Beijerinckiaceae bacterium]|nr:hypothetical protein [Beijerinckiaceae bacterium]
MPLIAFVDGSANVQFDPLKLTWLGTLSDSSLDAFVVWTRKRPDIQSVQDLLRPGGPTLTVGVAGVGATDNDVAVLLREVLGLRLKIVPGYQDSNTVALAVENGEVDGQLVNYITRKITHPAWADPNGKMQVLMQFARTTRLPELSHAPTAQELVKDDASLQLIRMAELPYVVSRPFAAPPGIPADRAEALQTAFINAARGAAMVDEARKLQLDLTPLDAKQTLAAVQELSRATPDLRKRLREILYVAPK